MLDSWAAVKRDECWILGLPPSGMNAGFLAAAKRDKCWVLGQPPSGMNAGFLGSRQAG